MNAVKSVNIVVVDDNINNLNLLAGILAEKNYKVRRAINGEIALNAIQASLPDLVLLDINLPDISGYQVCKSLKENSATRHIPIVFISALNEALDKVKAFAVGGVDYITKPFEMAEVIARIESQLAIQAAQAEVQHLNEVLEQRVRERTVQLERANQALQAEIAEHQQAQDRLLHLLLHDTLTDLPNLAGLMPFLQQAITRTQAHANQAFALILLDCDHFQLVNSSLGHKAGDQVLIEMSKRLKDCLPPDACLARLGGDEFMILLNAIQDQHTVEAFVEQLQQILTSPFSVEDQELFISVSLGIVLGNSHYTYPEHLLRDTDTAMYRAKRMGKAQYQIFVPEMHDQARSRLKVETDLRHAITQDELILHYQPILSIHSGHITGFEALVRWQHPKRGMVSPALFIPVAEETGLIIPVGLWVLREACQQLKRWQQEFPQQQSLTMSVNCSIRQFMDPQLVQQIDCILQETGVDGESIKLEITESALMENAAQTAEILWQLKELKIQLAIDDFGTGYSSLSYLHRLPVDTLKIDQSFIRQLSEPDLVGSRPGIYQNCRIVQSTINLAHDLDMDVVAEGIEEQEQLDILSALNCNFGQGYFWSKPLEAAKAADFLRSHFNQPIPDKRYVFAS